MHLNGFSPVSDTGNQSKLDEIRGLRALTRALMTLEMFHLAKPAIAVVAFPGQDNLCLWCPCFCSCCHREDIPDLVMACCQESCVSLARGRTRWVSE